MTDQLNARPSAPSPFAVIPAPTTKPSCRSDIDTRRVSALSNHYNSSTTISPVPVVSPLQQMSTATSSIVATTPISFGNPTVPHVQPHSVPTHPTSFPSTSASSARTSALHGIAGKTLEFVGYLAVSLAMS